MKVLAIDTSSRCGVIGLCVDGEPTAELALKSKETHSARLLPGIDWVLKLSGIGIEEIDAYGVTVGPGSFTGLRVGIATVKGLAWTYQKPVVELDSLKILALPFKFSARPIAPVLDARKDRIYGGVYKWSASGQPKLNALIEAADFDPKEFTKNLTPDSLLLGDGARKYFSDRNLADPVFDIPNGLMLAAAAFEKAEKGDTVDLDRLEPKYLRSGEFELTK